MIRYKAFPFELKGFEPDSGLFEGYASTFGNVDSYGDTVFKGAFRKTIKENLPNIKILRMHDVYAVIGKPEKMREDDVGLWVKGRITLNPDIPAGRQTYAEMQEGLLDALSIGYEPVKYEWNDAGGLDLHEIKLWEFSPVTWGADSYARITAVKAQDLVRMGPDDLRALFTDLEALLSQREPDSSTHKAAEAAAAQTEDPQTAVLRELVPALKDLGATVKQLKEACQHG